MRYFVINVTRGDFLTAIMLLVGLTAISTSGTAQSPPWRDVRIAENAREAKLARDLDAVALQVMLTPMFKSQSRGTFSAGAAGDHWNGLLVEQISRQLTRQGGLRLVAVPAGRTLKSASSRASSSESAGFSCALTPCRAPNRSRGVWHTTVVLPDDSKDGSIEQLRRRIP